MSRLRHPLPKRPLSRLSSSLNRTTTVSHQLGFPNLMPAFSGNVCTKTESKQIGPSASLNKRFPASEIQNGGGEGKRTPQMAATVTVLTCCILGFMCSSPGMCPPAIAEVQKAERGVAWRSYLLSRINGRKRDLKRWLCLNKCSLENVEEQFEQLLRERRLPVPELKKCVAKLEMIGKEDEAVRMLTTEIKKREGEGAIGEEAYELEMLLVEMLIFQGKYEDAKNQKCLQEGSGSEFDNRRPLYVAVINVMLGNIGGAKHMWNEAYSQMREPGEQANDIKAVILQEKKETREPGGRAPQRSPSQKTQGQRDLAFSKFLERVIILKHEIEVTKRSKSP